MTALARMAQSSRATFQSERAPHPEGRPPHDHEPPRSPGTAGLLAPPSVLPTAAAAQSAANDRGTHPLGDLALQSGKVLPKAQLSWRTHGTLSPGRDNVVLYPTSYSVQHSDLEWLIGPDGVLDPGRWFIVIPDMFGNGLSSSPRLCPFGIVRSGCRRRHGA